MRKGKEPIISDLIDHVFKLVRVGIDLSGAQPADIDDIFDNRCLPLLPVSLRVDLPLKLHEIAGKVLIDPYLAHHFGVVPNHLLRDHEVSEFL